MELISTLLLAMNLVSMGSKSTFEIITQLGPNSFEEMLIGHGVYLNQNLVKHSCHPNTIALIKDRRRYLFSSRPIVKGEQVSTTLTLRRTPSMILVEDDEQILIMLNKF
mgnify:CR=1 FL=1